MNNPSNQSLDDPKTFQRVLGIRDGIAILIGITIGAGIYSTPQKIAIYQSSASSILMLWLIAGFFVFLGGMIYAELGSRLPRTGGEYVYISTAFGPFAGFLFGWAQLFIIRTSPAAGLAIIVVQYLGHFVELSPLGETVACIAVILAIGGINVIGVRQASLFQIISTVIKVGGLLAIVILGLALLPADTSKLSEQATVSSEMKPFGLFAATMMLIVFSYLGWDRVGNTAGEMKNPKRTIAVSIFWGVAIVTICYLLANLVYHMTLGIEGVRGEKRVAAETATVLVGSMGASVVAIIVMISAAGSINGTMMTATRVYYVMARDGLFFKWFDHVDERFKTPARAIVAHCAWAIVILLARSNFESIITGMTFAVLIFYVVTTLAFFKLRFQKTGGDDVFSVPLVLPAIYLIGLVSLIAMRAYYQWQESLIDLAFVTTGIPFGIYFCFIRRRPAQASSKSHE